MSIIFIIGSIVSPNVRVSQEQFQQTNISVTIEWAAEEGISYTINVNPNVTINVTERNYTELVVSYDTEYNVSVIASLCGTNKTTFTTLHYGEIIRHSYSY